MERVLVVIPARWSSARYPGKPLVPIAGVPMIVRVARRAAMASLAGRVVVATDDDRIREAVELEGFEAVMTRPDHANGSERIAEAVEMLGGAEIVVNVQGDEPLLDPATVDLVVEALRSDSSLGCATPVAPITTVEELLSPSIVKVVVDHGGEALYFSRSPIPYVRDLPEERWPELGLHLRHIGIYAYRRRVLERLVSSPPSELERCEQLEQLRLLALGERIRCCPVSHSGRGVDTPEDREHVEQIILAEQTIRETR